MYVTLTPSQLMLARQAVQYVAAQVRAAAAAPKTSDDDRNAASMLADALDDVLAALAHSAGAGAQPQIGQRRRS